MSTFWYVGRKTLLIENNLLQEKAGQIPIRGMTLLRQRVYFN